MRVKIEAPGAYAMAYITLDHGQTVYVERGGLVAMSAGVQVGTGVKGGVARSAMRKMFGGEDFFMGRYTANMHGAWVAVSPPFPGDITTVDITPERPLLVEAGALLAAEAGLDVGVKVAGLSPLLLKVGVTMLSLSGTGGALFGTYGSLLHFPLQAGQQLVVDSGHLVGYTPNMRVEFGFLGGLVTAATSGEGLVGQFTGPGEVFVQTRAEQSLRTWLLPAQAQNTGRA
jgi:uncharacterized protein (TIGR00266 family)